MPRRADHFPLAIIMHQGIEVKVEIPRGTVRTHETEDGPVTVTYTADYGYRSGVLSHDGDSIDIFLGNHPTAPTAFLISQLHPTTRRLDEPKTMLGFNDVEQATASYMAHRAPTMFGGISSLPISSLAEQLRAHDGKGWPVRLEVDGFAGPLEEQGLVPWVAPRAGMRVLPGPAVSIDMTGTEAGNKARQESVRFWLGREKKSERTIRDMLLIARVLEIGVTREADEITNFPRAGDNDPVSLRTSRYRVFDVAYMRHLASNHQAVWGLAGSRDVNRIFRRIAGIAERGGDPMSAADELAIRTREALADRRYGDQGVTAALVLGKFLVAGGMTEPGMKRALEQAKIDTEEADVLRDGPPSSAGPQPSEPEPAARRIASAIVPMPNPPPPVVVTPAMGVEGPPSQRRPSMPITYQEQAHARRFSSFVHQLALLSLASGGLDPAVRGGIAALLARDATGGVPRSETPPAGLPEGGRLHRRSAHVRALREAEREVDYIASTETVDSYGEVVRQNWRLERFNTNPVILFAHDSHSLPIGQSMKTAVESKELIITVRFATAKANPFAEFVWQSVLERTLRGCSVGFFPHKVSREDIGGVNRVVLDDNELYELSVCPIPSNPDALDMIDEKMLSAEALERFGGTLLKSLDLDARSREELARAFRDATLLGEKNASPPAPPPANVPAVRGGDVHCQPGCVPFTPCDVSTDAWDQGKSIHALRVWASSDGSGELATIDFAKLQQGFALVKGDPKQIKSYLFPHHTVRDGKLVAVRQAVFIAASRMRDADLTDVERAGVQQHLGAEYRQMGAKAPWDTTGKKGASGANERKEGAMPNANDIKHPHIITLSADDAVKVRARSYMLINCSSCGDGHHIDLAMITDEMAKMERERTAAIERATAAEGAKAAMQIERDAAVVAKTVAETKLAETNTSLETTKKDLKDERMLRVALELDPLVGTGLHCLSASDRADYAEIAAKDPTAYAKLKTSAEARWKQGGGAGNSGKGGNGTTDVNANKGSGSDPNVRPHLPNHTPDPTERTAADNIDPKGAEDDTDLRAELKRRTAAMARSGVDTN
jgi:HK97 family phage prohead protease